MALVSGKYQFEKNENYFEYLKSLGPEITDEIASNLDGGEPIVDVKLDGTVCHISSSSGRGVTFILGQSFDEEVSPGIIYKSTGNLNGNNIETQTALRDGRTANRVFEFTETELTIYYSTSKCSAKRFLKRI